MDWKLFQPPIHCVTCTNVAGIELCLKFSMSVVPRILPGFLRMFNWRTFRFVQSLDADRSIVHSLFYIMLDMMLPVCIDPVCVLCFFSLILISNISIFLILV